jgi:nitroreductase
MNNNLDTASEEIIPLRPVKEQEASPSKALAIHAPKLHKLQPRHFKFIDYFRAGSSARKAALLAGFSESMANNASILLLQNPLIAAEIQRQDQESATLQKIDPEQIYDAVSNLANSNMADYIELDDKGRPLVKFEGLSREQMAAIEEIHYDANGYPQIKLVPKLPAYALLGKFKRMGMGTLDIGIGGEAADNFTLEKIDALVQQVVVNQTITNNYSERQPPPTIDTIEAEKVSE